MRRISIVVVSLWAAVAAAQAQPAERVALPAYESVRGLDHYADKATYEAAAADARFVMEQVEYPSGDLSLHAYVYRPADPKRRMPVVVFNRGSWTWPSFVAEMLPMAHRLAEKGYVVIAPWYRGSGGDAGRDEMGGTDLDDLFNLVPVIRTLPYADPSRMFMANRVGG
jgi:dipeptidyl aminopeptidase/acylaminoacyl peptidase